LGSEVWGIAKAAAPKRRRPRPNLAASRISMSSISMGRAALVPLSMSLHKVHQRLAHDRRSRGTGRLCCFLGRVPQLILDADHAVTVLGTGLIRHQALQSG